MAIDGIVQYTGGFLPDILLFIQAPIRVWFDGNIIVHYYYHPLKYVLQCLTFLKKNQNNTPRPSEHPPVRGKTVKTFRWDHNKLQIQNLFMAFQWVPLW